MKEKAKKMGETAVESHLQDRQRYNAYKRQREQASLEYPMARRERYAATTQEVKNYSPTKPDWDSDAVLDEACQKLNEKPMRWTAFARKHIPRKNCGQGVKDISRQNNIIDILQLDGRTKPHRLMRPRHLRFDCGDSFSVQK